MGFAEALSDDAAPCELKLGQVPHLAAPFGGHLASASSFGLDLPYHLLGGPGFERLCFHLLLAQGQQARFFGAQRLDIRNIFWRDELVHRHGCDNEFAAAKCVRVGSAEGRTCHRLVKLY